jgi:hypothetical protein
MAGSPANPIDAIPCASLYLLFIAKSGKTMSVAESIEPRETI